MTYIRGCMSSKFCRIRPRTTDLAALERRKKIPIDLQLGKLRHHIFLAVFDRILFLLAGDEDMHKSLDEFEFRPYPTTD